MDLEHWHRWWKHFGAVELRHLLLLHWDPIGVYGEPGAVDEYDSYVGQLGRLLREGADRTRVAEFLADVRTREIGMPPSPAADAEAADRVIDWFAAAMTTVGER